MSEIEKLCKKSYDKLKSSKALYELGQYSDSASLSYYCMFLMAKALLNKKGYDAKTHEGVIKLFSLKYVHEDIFNHEIYLHLPSSQSKREDADYSSVDYITQEIAENLISKAEEFLKESEKFL
ncbi:HEPN domain-containing protein [Methanobrevibacter sp.]|uniref:HEPN domain-containing protein n=1 Tax=Methanobrevibacter sp. TaxID=66852 RepID=UPI003870D7A5